MPARTLAAPAVVGLAGLLLAACGAVPPRVPPSELGDIEPSVAIAERWSERTGGARRGRFDPLVTDDAVYAAAGNGEVTRLERETGRTVWEVDLDVELSSGVGGDDERVYVATGDGMLVALSVEDGTEAWRTRTSSEVLAPAAAGFGALAVRSADGRVVALDPDTGTERWSASWTPPALTVYGYGTPRLLDGGMLVGLDDGRLVALDTRNGREIWTSSLSVSSGRSEVERLVDLDAEVALDDAGIYAVNYRGRAVRLEPARGEPVWSVPMSSVSGLVLAQDVVVIVDDESVVHGLDKATGREVWTQDALRGRRLSPPALTGEVAVVGDLEGYVHALALADGALVGRARPARSAIRARPVGDADSLVVQAEGGRVIALGVPAGAGTESASR